MENSHSINLAFSKQSAQFDSIDSNNLILADLRKQIYAHVEKYLRPKSSILELNAGTGIDASYFISKGHRVHATDLSDGMIAELTRKITTDKLTVQQLSYTELGKLPQDAYNYVFSNFGGLNCIQDLSIVAKELTRLLQPNSIVTWVVMPPVCPWEIAGILKGNKNALRRFNKHGVQAHLEGEYFQTYYHSLNSIKKTFGPQYKLIDSEGLAALSPPPYRNDLPIQHPKRYRYLRKIDSMVRNIFPFNRWADHIVVTFQLIDK
jgi:ubiquinone/menaquinone biosynthesis C-methylase UbiE